MADIDTNVIATPDEPGTNDVITAGTQTQSVQIEENPKSFGQDEVNRMIQARLAEQSKTLKSKFEKDLDAKIAAAKEEAQKDLDKLIEDRTNARLAEQELAKTRKAIAEEYALNEDQAALLQGANPEELTKHAEKVFGALKQIPKPKVPIIKTGAEGNSDAINGLDIDRMSPAEIRANKAKLWANAKAP